MSEQNRAARERLRAARENARMCMSPPCGNCQAGVDLAREALRRLSTPAKERP